MPKQTYQFHIYVRNAVLCNALVALLSALPLASAQAQTDSAAIVQSQENQSAGLAATWLGSSDARTRAWGAYLALRDRRRELLPQLIVLAEAYPVKSGRLSPTERDDHDAMLGVLDAIIQMDGKVPPELAAKLYTEFPVQAVIFLARGRPATSDFLLDIFQKENSEMAVAATSARTLAWLAAGDLLMGLRPRGFAAAILGGLTVHAGIRVVDEGSVAGLGPGIGGSCSGPVFPYQWAGWPLVGNYSFAGKILLAGGADPLFYARTVTGASRSADGGELTCGLRLDPDELREHLLAGLAGESASNPSVQSSVETTITWGNDDQYLRDLHAFINRQQVLFDKLSRKLMDEGLISAEERVSARPSLQVRISDERGKKPSSLPVIQDTASNVNIVK
jgi:hypothetical protein